MNSAGRVSFTARSFRRDAKLKALAMKRDSGNIPTTQSPAPLITDRSNPTFASARLIFYDFPLAYNPAKARIMLVEKGLPYTTVIVNILSSEGVSPAFIRLNPSASLPVLRDGGKLLTQSKEIVTYLDTVDGSPLGGKSVDRKQVSQWVDLTAPWDGNLFVQANVPAAAGALGLFGAFKKEAILSFKARNPQLRSVYDEKVQAMTQTEAKGSDPRAQEANRAELRSILSKAEATLSKQNFLAGSEYSAADALLSVILWRLDNLGQIDQYLSPRTFLSRYWGMIQARPSYNTVFGPSKNPFTAFSLAGPAVAQVLLQKVTGNRDQILPCGSDEASQLPSWGWEED
ncbi:MAG: hypothetical protein WDW38_009773 [Sanguina aurantia]